MKEIKFKRAHFIDEAKTKFHHVDEWGVGVKTGNHIANFVSPSSNNTALYFTDYQYTGLKDKNGKEIYEGDIIADGSMVSMAQKFYGVVGFSKGSYVIEKSNCDCGECLYDRIERYDDIEIIGNIYEHPHLLTGEGGDAG